MGRRLRDGEILRCSKFESYMNPFQSGGSGMMKQRSSLVVQ